MHWKNTNTNNQYTPSSTSFGGGNGGGFPGPWQYGPGVAMARKNMREHLKKLFRTYPDSTLEDYDNKLVSQANSMEEYLNSNTLTERIYKINSGGSDLPSIPFTAEFSDLYHLDPIPGFFEPNNAPLQSNYYGGSHSTQLQNDGMVPIAPNGPNATSFQQQPPNYSSDGQFGSNMGRCYSDSQMPIFNGGGNSFGATQNGNIVDPYVPARSYYGHQMQNFDQTYSHQGGLNYPQVPFQGLAQNTAPANSAHPTPYPYAPTHQPFMDQRSFETAMTSQYAPTRQPSMDQRSFETGMTSHQQRPLQQQTQKTTKPRGRPRSKGLFSGCHQTTGCQFACEYCGKHPRLVEFFLKRTVKVFRDERPKLCQKLDSLSQHLKKCNNNSCGCSKFRPYYRHAVDCLSDGFKELRVSQNLAPHSLKSMRSTQEIHDGGDDGELARKIMRFDDGLGAGCASVDQITSQAGHSEMGIPNETVIQESITSWDWCQLPALADDNFDDITMSLDDHAQGLKTVKLKTDGASPTASPSSVQTPHSTISQEFDQEYALKVVSSSKGV